MNKYTKYYQITIIFIIIFLFGCRTVDRQQVETKKIIINNAFKAGTPLFISLKGKKAKSYILKSAVSFNNLFGVVDAIDNSYQSLALSNVDYLSSNPKDQTGYFPFEFSNGKTDILASFISNNGNVYTLMSKEKYIVTLADKSKFQGKVSGIDYNKNEIHITTRYRDYSISGDIITQLNMFKVDAKVVLFDGSTRVGELTKDDGNEIAIKSLIGEENFKRKDVLKIEYQY